MDSAGVGGKPVRSRLTRLSKEALSASGEGVRESRFRVLKMKGSMEFLTQAVLMSGGCGFVIGWKAQWGVYSAPLSIQFRSVSTCFGVSGLPVSAGGMRWSGSADVTRFIKPDSEAWPATMALSLAASRALSSRRPFSCLDGPWQVMHLERIGRISLAKLVFWGSLAWIGWTHKPASPKRQTFARRWF